MVDTPTSRYRLRKQELGTNTNTWGDTKLNEVFDCVDQILGGVGSITLTGDLTLTTTNYTTADQTKNRVLIFTGTLAMAVSVVIPSVESAYLVVNKAGAPITIKTAAGAGVTIPDDLQADIYCDAVDVLNGAPTVFPTADIQVAGKITGVTAGTANSHAVNKAQMDAAIAAATTSSTPGTLRVTSNDTTAKFLDGAIDVVGITKEVQNPGANEVLRLTALPYWTEPRVVANADSPVAALDRDIIKVLTSTGAVQVNLPASGRVWIVDEDGNSDTNNITVNPPGSDTVTIDTVDLPRFSGIWEKNGTNWGIR